MYNPVENHFCCFIRGNYYDITGKITNIDRNWYDWKYYKELDPIECDRIIKQCVYKDYD